MRATTCLAFLTIFFLGHISEAKTRIAFLELYNSRGELIQYEPTGRFGHTAIQSDLTGEMWLNSYPTDGVRFITWTDLNKHGTVAEIIEVPQNIDLNLVSKFIGKPFDYAYQWSDEAFYCSELIGKLLNIPTHPMRFNHQVWPPHYWHLEGTTGLSPDSIWKWAKDVSQ